MKKIALAIVGLVVGAAVMLTVVEVARAQPGSAEIADAGVKTVEPFVGSGSAATPAPAAAPLTDPTPKIEDVSLMTKLWKSGAFFAFGIMALYVGLFAWSKLDKKRAFYAATALGGVALLVESIRAGNTPNVATMVSVLGTTIGILITGPARA